MKLAGKNRPLPDNVIETHDEKNFISDLKEFYEQSGFNYVSTHPLFGPTFANLGKLFDENAGLIGTIDSVDDSTQNILFQVGKRLIPAAEDWITDINHKERNIHMSLPEGLLEL